MSVSCACLIEFTPTGAASPIVLAEPGDWLAELPVFEAAQGMFEAEGVDSYHDHFQPLGGATVTISLVLEEDDADQLAMLDGHLSAALPGGGEALVDGVLRITGDNQVATYDPAVLVSLGLGLGPHVTPAHLRALTFRAALPTLSPA